MVLNESKVNIVCDVKGCNDIARYFIRKDRSASMADSLKLCPTCAVTLLKILDKKLNKKENSIGKNI